MIGIRPAGARPPFSARRKGVKRRRAPKPSDVCRLLYQKSTEPQVQAKTASPETEPAIVLSFHDRLRPLGPSPPGWAAPKLRVFPAWRYCTAADFPNARHPEADQSLVSQGFPSLGLRAACFYQKAAVYRPLTGDASCECSCIHSAKPAEQAAIYSAKNAPLIRRRRSHPDRSVLPPRYPRCRHRCR